ncbi:hypothetical protein ElyMa_000889500 [Elysia marginata]|uniref:CABIT domain-containing protein n=1 Tax=Elysia marginata TaxID=1093978 RepID=A0AAV4H9A3_9GAST|nr:hypothetical protein ElyMa_000889500 [Elysia marginata]
MRGHSRTSFPSGCHFLRLKSRTVKDNTVHRTVGSLAVNHVPAFVNLTTLNTFQLATNGGNRYPPLEFAPGNVFIIEKPIRGSTRVKSGGGMSNSSLLRRTSANSSISRQELHYLKCRDERNVEILVPMSHPGEFVEVLPSQFNSANGDSTKLSMPTEDIISAQKFPLLARYVYGGSRPRLTSFSGLLTMLDSFEETSIVGCVIDGASFTLLEIPQSSPLLFQIALNSHDLFSLPVVRHALRVCETNGSTFARDLKFKFKFAQRILHTGHRHASDDPPSATNSARMGVTQTYLYL